MLIHQTLQTPNDWKYDLKTYDAIVIVKIGSFCHVLCMAHAHVVSGVHVELKSEVNQLVVTRRTGPRIVQYVLGTTSMNDVAKEMKNGQMVKVLSMLYSCMFK